MGRAMPISFWKIGRVASGGSISMGKTAEAKSGKFEMHFNLGSRWRKLCQHCCPVFRAHREVFQSLARYQKLYSEWAASVFCQLSGIFALVAFERFGFLCRSHTTHWTSSNICMSFQFNINSFPTPVLPVSLSSQEDSFLLRPHHSVCPLVASRALPWYCFL